MSLRTISDSTRISFPALEALERNDISKLPGGIFSRAFIRSYAGEVGLDPETTVEEFVRQFPHDSVTVGHRVTVHTDPETIIASRRRLGWVTLVTAIVAIPLVVAAVYMALSRLSARRSEGPMQAGTTTSTTAPKPMRIVVDLTATAPCTVAYASDGQPAIDVSLPAGSRRTIEARETLTLTVSDPAAVSVRINGAMARPLGEARASATAAMNLDNLQSFLVTP